MRYSFLRLTFISILFSGCYYDNEEELYPQSDTSCALTTVSFNNDVKPIISSNCLSCHSQAVNSGNVILESYSHVKSYADNGKLYGSISHSPGHSPMPKNSPKLSECKIGIIKKWIDGAAPNN